MTAEVVLDQKQQARFAPLVREASAMGNNVLFVATCAPDNGCWRLQAMVVTARVGSKLLAIVKKEATAVAISDVDNDDSP
jgi:hypothetical protein